MQEQGRTWYFTGEMCKSGEADKVGAIIFRDLKGTKSKGEEDASFGMGSNHSAMGLGTIAQMKC